jgi:hypothetical protein
MLTASVIAAALAQAQLEQTRELHRLPENDFTSNWGQAVENTGRSSPDFHVGGFEAGFQCGLAGRFLARSKGAHQRIQPREAAEFAKGLRLSMFFIWDATALMNGYHSELDWATLVCTRREINSEENPQRRVDEKQKMQRELDRRRKQETPADD